MFIEHDIVILQISLLDIEKDAVGTVVYVYGDGLHYLVEFILSGRSTVRELSIEELKPYSDRLLSESRLDRIK